MKKLLLSAILFSGLAFGQNFKLTPENFKNEDGKDYYVAEIVGKTKAELFKSAKLYINSNYKNLKGDGYNEVENEQITLRLRENAYSRALGISFDFPFTNHYEINFKDGKIMVKPVFDKVVMNDGSGGSKDVFLTGGNFLGKSVFNKKGEVSIKKNVFDDIQNKTNEFVKSLIAGINKNNDW